MSAMDHKAKTSKHAAKLAADPRFAGWVAAKPGNPAAAPKIYDQAEMDAAVAEERERGDERVRQIVLAELVRLRLVVVRDPMD